MEQKSPKKQVKPVWNGKLLKYRNFKVSELNKENLPLRTQPEISFSEQVRILKKYIQELHLIWCDIYLQNIVMAKAKKEGKKGKSRKSVLKTLRMIQRNEELIKQYENK